MTTPITLAMIVRNEPALEKHLQTIRPYVDEIVIVDTGSDDGTTQDVARKIADKFEIFTICNDDQGRIENFAMARQRSYDLATHQHVLWIDGDDEVVGGENLHAIVDAFELARKDHPAYVMLKYIYDLNEHGKPNTVHYRERITAPTSSFEWRQPVHEVLTGRQGVQNIAFGCEAVDGMPMIPLGVPEVVILHNRQKINKVVEPGRNLRILRKYYDGGDRDVRTYYYLGLELGNNGFFQESIDMLAEYTKLSGWDDEKCLAMLRIISYYTHVRSPLLNYENALEWSLRAIAVKDQWCETWFAAARCFYFMAQTGKDTHENYRRCVRFAQQGLACPPTRTMLFENPGERNFDIHLYLNKALAEIGDVEAALDSADRGLMYAQDPGLLMNRNLYVDFLSKKTIRMNLDRLVNIDRLSQEQRVSIDQILDKPLDKTPETLSAVADVVRNVATLMEKPLSPTKDIAIYVGASLEPWNPETARQRGIGGSETAVIEMAKRLVRRGKTVTVYGDVDRAGLAGVFDGVTYKDYRQFQNLNVDVLITSRRAEAVDDGYNIKAKIVYGWVHDTCFPNLDPERSYRIDRFLCLTQWHRDCFLSQYPYVSAQKVIVTQNGIDVQRFNQQVSRNPHKAVYASSPDRGMEAALELWPHVRAQIPDAELHVFYGFENWDKMAEGNPEALQVVNRLKSKLAAGAQHGVHARGRVDQLTLAREYMSACVWFYPTFFAETSCISAMEAQAAGLRIVTSPIAALNETVADRGTLIGGEYMCEAYKTNFVNATVAALRKEGSEDRRILQNFARDRFDWNVVADSWCAFLDLHLEETQRALVPPYVPVLERSYQ